VEPGSERLALGAEATVVAREHHGLRPQPFCDGDDGPVLRVAHRCVTNGGHDPRWGRLERGDIGDTAIQDVENAFRKEGAGAVMQVLGTAFAESDDQQANSDTAARREGRISRPKIDGRQEDERAASTWSTTAMA
jgi:hypothetical protein